MKEKKPVSKRSHPELLAKKKEYFSKFEELRGFL
jgi:hypothetical protein